MHTCHFRRMARDRILATLGATLGLQSRRACRMDERSAEGVQDILKTCASDPLRGKSPA